MMALSGGGKRACAWESRVVQRAPTRASVGATVGSEERHAVRNGVKHRYGRRNRQAPCGDAGPWVRVSRVHLHGCKGLPLTRRDSAVRRFVTRMRISLPRYAYPGVRGCCRDPRDMLEDPLSFTLCDRGMSGASTPGLIAGTVGAACNRCESTPRADPGVRVLTLRARRPRTGSPGG